MPSKRTKRQARPTKQSRSVEDLYPAIAQWVQDGWIEIGDQDGIGFVTRALDYGGMPFEDTKARTLGEAMDTLERAIQAIMREQG